MNRNKALDAWFSAMWLLLTFIDKYDMEQKDVLELNNELKKIRDYILEEEE